ncbi:hypothetical protein OF83DRAFT_1058748 [Amylostereum chailletii]|nr:hypothetical protein OF83DRAFT_1058748 [Amylostereum chailletii]
MQSPAAAAEAEVRPPSPVLRPYANKPAPVQHLYTTATKAELKRDFDTAFKLYIKAANAYLTLSRSASEGDARQALWRKEAGKAVERAEKIKEARRDLMPVVRNWFAVEEQELVLQKGAVVNGVRTQLWMPSSAYDSGGIPYSYVPLIHGLLALSEEQKTASIVWRRPSEVFGPNASMDLEELRPEDIVQRVVADCSLCASVVICLVHERKFRNTHALPCVRPCGRDGKPRISETGRYELRVLFNGAYRTVLIDDLLPFSAEGTMVCMAPIVQHNIWPSIVEKAYLKLMGGYDFPGSNSAIDVHALTGWLPEHIEIRRRSFQREQTWNRIFEGFHNGMCMLTLGTDIRPSAQSQWEGVKFLVAHSYAVIAVSPPEDESRWITVLESLLPTVCEASNGNVDIEAQIERMALANDSRERSIRIPWDDACSVFESLYVSWNPKMFNNQTRFHGIWRPSHLSDADKAESAHQVLHLVVDPSTSASGDGDLWILLTRHRTNTRLDTEFISLQVEQEDTSDAREVLGSTNTRGTYTNSPHVLIRTTMPPSGGTFAVTTSYEGQHGDVGYTVDVHSSRSTRWDETVRKLPFDTRVNGAFTSKSGGGNHTLPTYMHNPQYKLSIPPPKGAPRTKCRVALDVQSGRDVPVNVAVVWGQGERVYDLTKSDILASSGAYSYGYASASKDLAPGTYTVVVSAFEPAHQGPFALHLASSHPTQLEAIPQEGAGMFTKTIRGEWSVLGLTGGRPTCQTRTTQGPRYTLTLPSLAQIKIRLQPLDPSASTSVSVALYPQALPQQRQQAQPVLTSGAHTDAPSGAVTPLGAVRAGTYALVPAKYDVGADVGGKFRVTVYCSSAGVKVEEG